MTESIYILSINSDTLLIIIICDKEKVINLFEVTGKIELEYLYDRIKESV